MFFFDPFIFFKNAAASCPAFDKPSLDFQWADLMERFDEEKTDDDDINSVVHGYHLA